MGPKGAAFALALVVAAAACAVPTWRQVVAAASWAVGVGSLLVAPAAGVVVADYWLCRDRFVDREALADGTPGGAYYYGGGVNARALLAVLVGAAPGVVEICRNFAAAGGDVASLVTGYVLNSEYSSLISTAAAFTAYLLFTLVSTPESLKEARAEAAAMTEEERLARREAAEAAEEARLARESAAREAEYYVDGADATARANDASSARRVETTSRSDGVDEETTEEVTTTTEEVVVGDATEVITTTIIKRRTRKVNTYINRALASAPKRAPAPPPDVDDVDLDAARRFYEGIADRIKAALAPARKAEDAAIRALKEATAEEQKMLQHHVEMRGKQTMREVRYETMRAKELLAEANLAAADVTDELAEAWLFFEDEGEEDCAAIEATLEKRATPGSVRATRWRAACTNSSTRRARVASTPQKPPTRPSPRNRRRRRRRAPPPTSRAKPPRSFARRTRSSLNFVTGHSPWARGAPPPVMDVPMLPMSDAEARLRAREDERRAQHDSQTRLDAEEESRRRAEEDARRALAEADLRRMIEDEDRARRGEEARRRAADDEIARLRALSVATAAEAIETTKTTITRPDDGAPPGGGVDDRARGARREQAEADIARAKAELDAAAEAERERRAAFDERIEAMREEEARLAAEAERREAWGSSS